MASASRFLMDRTLSSCGHDTIRFGPQTPLVAEFASCSEALEVKDIVPWKAEEGRRTTIRDQAHLPNMRLMEADGL